MTKNDNIVIDISKLGDAFVLKLCIDNGYNVNATNSNGNSALHNAVKKLDIDIVNLLIEKNIDVNIKNKDHVTPLFGLLFENKSKIPRKKYREFKEIIKTLLNNKASLKKDQVFKGNDCFFSLAQEHVNEFNEIYFENNDIDEFNKSTNLYLSFLKDVNIKLDDFVYYDGIVTNELTRLSIIDKGNYDLSKIDNKIISNAYFDFFKKESPLELLYLLKSIDNKLEIKDKISFKNKNFNSLFYFSCFLYKNLNKLDKNKKLTTNEKNNFVHVLFYLYGNDFKENIKRVLTCERVHHFDNYNQYKEFDIIENMLKICCLTTKNSTINLLDDYAGIFSISLDELKKKEEQLSLIKKSTIKEVEKLKSNVIGYMGEHDKVVFSQLNNPTNTNNAFLKL